MMDMLSKTIAGALIAVMLGVVLSKQNKEAGILLTTLTCCLIGGVVILYLQPVMDFFTQLQTIGNLDQGILKTLLKATGIVIISEIAIQICADAGNSALSKCLQLLTTAAVLWLSLPLFTSLIELIDRILGNS